MKVLLLWDEAQGDHELLGIYATMEALLAEYPGDYKYTKDHCNGVPVEYELMDSKTGYFIVEREVKGVLAPSIPAAK